MDTLLATEATPDASEVNVRRQALQERRFHVLKNDDNFAILDSIGDMLAAPGSNDGLYYRDTRHLSQLSLLIGGARPLLLSSSLSRDSLMLTANLANARIRDVGGEQIDQGLIYIRRSVFLVGGACFNRLALLNYGMQPAEFMVHLGFEADFADLFEVRGMHRAKSRDATGDRAGIGFRAGGLPRAGPEHPADAAAVRSGAGEPESGYRQFPREPCARANGRPCSCRWSARPGLSDPRRPGAFVRLAIVAGPAGGSGKCGPHGLDLRPR